MTVKINKTTRIRVTLDHTVYVSNQVARGVSDLCVRLENNVLAPAKGNQYILRDKLVQFARELPDHFTSNGRHVLGVH